MIASRWASRTRLDIPIQLLIISWSRSIFSVITQWKKQKGEGGAVKERLRILEWVFLASQPRTSVQPRLEAVGEAIKKGRTRVLAMTGAEPDSIHVPMSAANWEWALRHSTPLQLAFLDYSGILSTDMPTGKNGHMLVNYTWVPIPRCSEIPVKNGLTVFTDAGRASQQAAATWYKGGQWHEHMIVAQSSDTLQTLELAAVCWTLTNWMAMPLNIVTDSLHVARVVQRIEDAFLREIQNQRLFKLFQHLQRALMQRTAPYGVIHIRSHKWQEGLGEGNHRADQLVSVSRLRAPLNQFEAARTILPEFKRPAPPI